MRQHLESETQTGSNPARLERAAENLKRILRELEPYTHKPAVREVSTEGTWTSSDGSLPQVVTED